MLTYADVCAGVQRPRPANGLAGAGAQFTFFTSKNVQYCLHYFWYKRTNTDVPPTAELAQIRQTVVEQLILPLGSLPVHQKAPYVNKALLYGPAGTGKTPYADVC